MFRRNFLKRTLAGSTLLGATGAAAARRRKSVARVENFDVQNYTDVTDDEVTIKSDADGVSIRGQVASPGQCLYVKGHDVSYQSGTVRLEVTYGTAECRESPDGRRVASPLGGAEYEAEIDVLRETDSIVVDHVEAGAAAPSWRFETDGDARYAVEFEELGASSDYRNEATIDLTRDGVTVEGTVRNGACRLPDLTGVAYEDGDLTLSVDAVEDPNGGDVCVTAMRGLEYRADVTFSEPIEVVTVEHNDEWTTTSKKRFFGGYVVAQ